MSCNAPVTAIKNAVECQEACGKCKLSWAIAQTPLLTMWLIQDKYSGCSSWRNPPTELCKAVRSPHLARFFEFCTGLSAAFSAESEESENHPAAKIHGSIVTFRNIDG